LEQGQSSSVTKGEVSLEEFESEDFAEGYSQVTHQTYYIVYQGVQRYRDGSVKPRTRVKKVHNVEGKPKIASKRIQRGELWVTIEAPQTYTLRNGRKTKRIRRRDIHLGRAKNTRNVRLTTRPPKGPKIDRKKRKRKRGK